MFREYLNFAAYEMGVNLSEIQVDLFSRYCDLLLEWNKVMNLTAIVDPKEIAIKHMIDSISCYDKKVFFPSSRVVDVGTGAGFPGIPLKIYSPEISVTLIDSLQKRLKFLQVVIDQLQLTDVVTLHDRVEDVGRDKKYREKYDVATSRAVAKLSVLCEYCLPLVKVGGYFVALKGSQVDKEVMDAMDAIKTLGGSIKTIRQVSMPKFADQHAVIYIKKIRHTPEEYPRRAGVPEKKPL